MSFSVAFWNLQNLFDTVDDPISRDLEFTPEEGWTEEVLDAKLGGLASIVDELGDGAGPDLLGVCEVENDGVLRRLVDRLDRDDLDIASVASPDIRGIDCSLVYSRDVFEPAGPPVGHLVNLRYPTRDVFEVPLRVRANGAELVVFVNHWPSRRLGRYESEPLRIAVASHVGRLVDAHLRLDRDELATLDDSEAAMAVLQQRWDANVLVMGDLNDEPYDRSVLGTLNASSGTDKLEEPLKPGRGRVTPEPTSYLTKQAYLFNCMWPEMGRPDRGTHFYGSSVNTMNLLDQLIVSRGLYYGLAGLRMRRRFGVDGDERREVAAEIHDSDTMITSQKTRRPRAFTFGRRADGSVRHNRGYSDHFPIQALVDLV